MNPVRLSLILALAFGCGATAQTSEKTSGVLGGSAGVCYVDECVAPGVVQVEGGFTFSVDGDGAVRERTLTFGSPMVRVGVGRSVELRAGGDGMDSSGAPIAWPRHHRWMVGSGSGRQSRSGE